MIESPYCDSLHHYNTRVCVCVVEILKGKMIFKGFQEAEKEGGGLEKQGVTISKWKKESRRV